MAREDETPRGWIQWKGTDVCMDIHCECGELSHIDGCFAYHVRCPYCGKVYACCPDIKLTACDGTPDIEPLDAER